MSILWKHFTDEGSEKVRCKYCNIIVSYKKGNRSIMRKHLERKHPETLGITTKAMTEESFIGKSEQTIACAEIHPIFHIERNIKYFIQMVYERPTLYEYSRLIGWNSKQNKSIWQELADTFQVDVAECQKFWKYLRETYDLHSRNPKLDDHKYANELSFLGEMYKKRRQRKEDLARQRKLQKTVENISKSPLENSFITKTKEELVKKPQSIEILGLRENESITKYEIYEDCSGNYDVDYIENNTAQFTVGDVNSFIMKDVKAEDIVIFDDNSSLTESPNIISLVNNFTQTELSGPVIPTNQSKDDIQAEENPAECIPSTRCKKCSNEFDELDLLMEFIKRKIRKFPMKDMNKLQIKILKTVMDAEKDIKLSKNEL
ncbi:uncharacterized protein LOC129605566 [Condylostylus longicornis]|uniref:uncharacterized protein LOC129605566 n=1 Tax=Condylostylus longicornis TaxID=2530218 RepID=UPI00244DCD3A|nr:uncharacterized protein LOC129605566 [Condylostylus longicornis]